MIRVYFYTEEILNNFLSLFTLKTLSLKKAPKFINNISNYDDNFLQWFIGFTDAEGNFLIKIKNKSEAHFVFQMTLHIEDSAVLYYIREQLGVGIVRIRGQTCSFRIHAFETILNILIPIFDKYSLLTHKQLDYKDWRKSVFVFFFNKKSI